MKCLDLTLPTPAENLAYDEALLDFCEETGGAEILRFWQPQEFFVVVGYANKVAAEVNLAACEAEKIPVLRRCSGGGTVLQGPGCLNYSLVLKIKKGSPLESIAGTNKFVLNRNAQALSPLLGKEVELKGQTDLTVGDLKFSGNAQRRKKNFLLFHGTFLWNFNFSLIGKFLRMPSKEPAYRRNRIHAEFLMNLYDVPAISLKSALVKAWHGEVSESLKNLPFETINRLAREKYSTQEWNLRF